MTNSTKKINNWGILNLFLSYLKHNKAIIFSIFFLPLIFSIVIFANSGSIFQGNVSGSLILMIIWIVQSASFATQTFLAILLDFKQTIIYRRIGLTRIKKINFLIMSSFFNLILMTISNFFTFCVTIILAIAFKQNALLNSIFQWDLALIVVFTLVILILLTSIGTLMSVLIKNRTGQAIASIIVNLLIIAPLFALTFFLHYFVNGTSAIIAAIGVGAFVGIFIAAFILVAAISALFYFLSWNFFKWYE